MEKSLVWKIKGSNDLPLSSETSELPDTICFIGLDGMEIFSHAITAWVFFPQTAVERVTSLLLGLQKCPATIAMSGFCKDAKRGKAKMLPVAYSQYLLMY